MVIAGGVGADGEALDLEALGNAFSLTREMYRLLAAPGQIRLLGAPEAKELVRRLDAVS
jgi:hypothetical protein